MSSLHAIFALPLAAAFAAAQTPCDQLKLSLPNTTATSIDFVPAGPFVAPAVATPPVAPAPGCSCTGGGPRWTRTCSTCGSGSGVLPRLHGARAVV